MCKLANSEGKNKHFKKPGAQTVQTAQNVHEAWFNSVHIALQTNKPKQIANNMVQ